MQYEKDLGKLNHRKGEAETFLVNQLDEVNQKLEGNLLSSCRVIFKLASFLFIVTNIYL